MMNVCIMPEMPYCPACKFGRISQPEWCETYADTLGVAGESDWQCLCTQEAYETYLEEGRDSTGDEA